MRRCTRCGETKPLTAFSAKSYRCKPCCVEVTREWAQANPERVRASRQKNRGSQAERSRRWYANNRALAKARAAEFDRANPEQHRERVRRRRARLRGATVERVDYEAILVRDGRWCYLCGEAIDGAIDFDHVVPISRGGAHAEENVRVSHPSCNRRKGGRLVAECEWVVQIAA